MKYDAFRILIPYGFSWFAWTICFAAFSGSLENIYMLGEILCNLSNFHHFFIKKVQSITVVNCELIP